MASFHSCGPHLFAMTSSIPEFHGSVDLRATEEDIHFDARQRSLGDIRINIHHLRLGEDWQHVGKVNCALVSNDERVFSLYAFRPGGGQGKDPESLAEALGEFKNDASLYHFFCADDHIIVITQRPPTDHEVAAKNTVMQCSNDFQFKLLVDLCQKFDHSLPQSFVEIR